MLLDWTKWVDIIGGLSLFILNLVINNRIMTLQLTFQKDMTKLKDSIEISMNATMMPRAECMQAHADMIRRMDQIDKHIEATDQRFNSYIRNGN